MKKTAGQERSSVHDLFAVVDEEVPGVRLPLPYGQAAVETTLPGSQTTVVEPVYVPGASDPAGLLRDVLQDPLRGKGLRHLVSPGQSIAIAVCDTTPPRAQLLMIDAVLADLAGVVDLNEVTILVVGGRRSDAAIEGLASTPGSPRVVRHDPDDAERLVWLGEHGRSIPVWLNREWFDADVRISAGVVEPHVFTGFSGGLRLVVPGLVGTDTVAGLYGSGGECPPMAWGRTEANPVFTNGRALAAAVGNVDFALDILLNRDQQIVAAYGGSPFHVDATARRVAGELALCAVRGRYEVVVTTNLGYPRDRTLYECIPALVAAAEIIKPGGTIVLVAQCSDGLTDLGSKPILTAMSSPDLMRSRMDFPYLGVLAKILDRANVAVYSEGVNPDELAELGVGHTTDVGDSVRRLLATGGPGARACVLPEGGRTVPYRVG